MAERSALRQLTGVLVACSFFCLELSTAHAEEPSIQVSRRVTSAERPLLTGVVENAVGLQKIETRIEGLESVLSARLFPSGEWIASLDEPLENGLYTLLVAAHFEDGRTIERRFEEALNVDLEGPEIAVDPLRTNDVTPVLTGQAVDQAGLRSVEVSIAGRLCPAVVKGSFWEADVEQPLPVGTHPATVAAVDSVGNKTTETFAEAVVIDQEPPVVLVTPTVTEDATPAVLGRAEDAGSGIERVVVLINGVEYTAEIGPEGDWLVADDVIEKPLEIGVYDVEAVATDRAGNAASDVTEDELRIVGNESSSGAAVEEE